MPLFAAGTKAQEQSMPTRHIHKEMAGGQAKMLGHLPETQQLKLNIDPQPAPELGIKLWHISGLDNFSIPQPAGLKRDPQAQPHTTGSGPSGDFLGSDFRAAYYGGTALTGAGQSVGLLEFAGYNQADVTKYSSTVGQPLTVSVVGVLTDGSSLSCTRGCDDTEQVLDIEVAISMAPGMNQVRVYVSDTSDVSKSTPECARCNRPAHFLF